MATLALAVVILAIGYAYDLAFKGTAWSWVPFAIGIPLLPVFALAWTVGTLPASFAILIPVAVAAGAALAIANARADLERDVAAGVDSIAVRLGLDRSWAVDAGLLALVGRGRRRDARGRHRARLGHRRRDRGWGPRRDRGAAWADAATARDGSERGSSRRSVSACSRRSGSPGWSWRAVRVRSSVADRPGRQ